ncbi:MAG: hypothetical protein H6708_16860 [Kofleriaceae bacterium]|nr:hypothetical protein [Kofleriaceae bacterium]
MRSLAPAALIALCGCAAGGDARPAPVPDTPVPLPCTLADDAGRVHGYRMALDETLRFEAGRGADAVAAMFAEQSAEMGDVLGLATRRDPVRVSTLVTCPDAPFLLGSGVVTDVVVGLATAIDDGAVDVGDELRSVVLRGAYADWSDGWRIHVTPPRDLFAGMQVLTTRAEAWLSIGRRWATIDVTMTVMVDDHRLVLTAPPLEAAVQDRGAPLHAGFRLVTATAAGRPADLALGTGGYLVIGSLPRGPVELRLRFEGPVPLLGDNHAEARLLELSRWLPAVPFGPPGMVDVTVHHPRDEELVASLPAAPGRDDGERDAQGWAVTRVRGVTDRDPALLLLDGRSGVRSWDDGAGSRIDVIASPPLPVEACAPALARVVRALAPLGPVGRVRVVAVPSVFGRHGRRADDLVVVLRSVLVDLCSGEDGGGGRVGDDGVRRRHVEAVDLLAHELAHGWFGREVRAADDEAAAWWEAAAEYVATWALDDVAAAEVRREWLDDYAEVAHRDLFAMAQRIPTAGKLRDALSYGKGALLLTALEDRIGRDRMAAMLRYFVASGQGRIASWLDLVAATQAVAGLPAAQWLQRWLTAIGAPELGVRDVTVAGGRLRFAITQDASPPFDAAVDVAVMDGERLASYAHVALSGARTAVDLALPRGGATRVVVDPWSRLPRFGVAEADLPARAARGGAAGGD